MTQKQVARDKVEIACKLYLRSQVEQEHCHKYLKDAILEARTDGLTQQEIADATEVQEGDTGFRLSRQRISQIVNGD